MHRTLLVLLVTVPLVAACAAAPRRAANPAAPGFRAAESDPRAIEIADAVMARLGGRAAWDATRVLRWTFFGMRSHVWDRSTNLVRVEGMRRDDGAAYAVALDLDDGAGRAWLDGREVTDDRERDELLATARSAWINDAYWLVMPYKLKDSGVRLRDLGRGAMIDGRPADVLELTFRDVGETPENAYHVYVATDTGLVEQWDFFRSAGDEAPAFRIPWANWRRYGAIMLSGDRGERHLTEIGVFDSAPAGTFDSPAPVPWTTGTGRRGQI